MEQDNRLTPKPDLPGELEDIELMDKDLQGMFQEEYDAWVEAHEKEASNES